MIKKFESFKELSSEFDESQFEYCYSKIINLSNDSYPSPDHLVHKYLNDKFFDYDQLVKPLNEVESDITKEDKKNVIKLYSEIYKEYDLGNFPELDDLLIIFEDLLQKSNDNWFSILLNEKKIQFVIHLPDVKHYPKDTSIEFNWNNFNENSSELNVAISRLIGYGYKVETYINNYFIIKVNVSN
jgi:hypothetical protein